VYVAANAGFLSHDYAPEDPAFDEDTETKFAYGGTLGVDIPMGPRFALFVEGRFLATSGTKLIPIFAGFTFTPGGGM
jgi:hypothetical protein